MRDLRKKDNLEAAAGDTLNQTLTIQRLDVCSDESVAECINSLPEKQLDVLGRCSGGKVFYIGCGLLTFMIQS